MWKNKNKCTAVEHSGSMWSAVPWMNPYFPESDRILEGYLNMMVLQGNMEGQTIFQKPDSE